MAVEALGETRAARPRMGLMAPLRLRNYLLLWTGTAISQVGDNFQAVALPVLLLDLTHRPSGVGAVLTVQAIPRTLLLLAGGLAADRYRPRSVLLVSNLVQGLVVAALVVLAGSGVLTLPHLYVYAAAYGIVAAFLLPAARSIIPELVPDEQVRGANALTVTTSSLARFVAPPIAGAVIAVAGVTPAFAVDAVSFLVAAYCVSRMRLTASPRHPVGEAKATAAATERRGGLTLAPLREGIAAAREDAVVWATLIIAAVFFLGYAGAVFVGLPALAKLTLGAGDRGVGALYGAMGVGALLGAIATGAVLHVRRPATVACALVVATGVTLSLVGFAPSLYVAVPLLALAGALSATSPILFATLVQTRTAAHARGRVVALLTLGTVGLQPLSYAFAGIAGDALGPRALLLLGGAIAALAGVYGLAQRAIRQQRSV